MSDSEKGIGNGISFKAARKRGLRMGVILFPVLIFGFLVLMGFLNASAFTGFLWDVFLKIMVNFGWLIDLGCLGFVVFMVILLITPIGNIKFGGKSAKPEYDRWNWWAISLCAGIGTGIVLWGPVEPLWLAMEPAKGMGLAPGSQGAALWAMEKSFLHWAFTPYAIYITVAVAAAYVVFNMNEKYNISSSFAILMGKKANSTVFSGIVDALTVFAITGGVAGSLGYGIMQIGSGIGSIAGVPVTPIIWFFVALAIIIGYNISSITGIDKGIKWLSDKNAWLFIALLVVMFIIGPKAFTLNLGTQAAGQYFNNFISSMTFTNPFHDAAAPVAGVAVTLADNAWPAGSDLWPQWWDMYWFTDWLSFGPIVGLFLVKLAKGRTIREFVVVNWVLPSAFALIWFSIFGGLAIDIQFNPAKYTAVNLLGQPDLFAYMKEFGYESLMLKVLEAAPLAALLKPIMLVIVALSFVTLADSMTSTVALMTIKNNEGVREAPMQIKLGWGVLMGATSFIFVLNGGLDGIKVVKTIAGFPILFLEIAICVTFLVYIIKRAQSGHFKYEAAGMLPAEADQAVTAES
ncbi:MAG: BCCT family transporter [Treponema sp.]|jgi:choline-glycine betaine transporter|nr:BCCT family transporter [Treponema sp.]